MRRLLYFVLLFLLPVAHAQQVNIARMNAGINAQTGTSYNVVPGDALFLVTFCNVNPVGVSLPAVSTLGGKGVVLQFKNICAGLVTITPSIGQIDGGANITLAQNAGIDLYNDGTNYRTQGGSGSGGGSGIVGPCATMNALAKFGVGPTTVGCATPTDDGATPTRTPLGVNIANAPLTKEWNVGAGGVLAGHTACRLSTSAIQVATCPAGATVNIVGVSEQTVGSGGVARVDMFGTTSVCTTNNTTVNDWLIPSVTVAGCVDDTGTSVPPFLQEWTYQAENAVLANANVQVTQGALDTAFKVASSGSVTTCTLFGLAYYSGTSVINCIVPAANLNGAVYYPMWKTTGSLVAPTVAQAGVLPRALASSDAIVCGDVAPGIVEWSGAGTSTVTVPDIGSTPLSNCFSSNPVFKAINGNGTLTFNRTSASSFRVANCINSVLATSFSLNAGTTAVFSKDADGTDWSVSTCSVPQGALAAPTPTYQTVSSPYTVPNADNGYRDISITSSGIFSLATPNTISTSPIVARRYGAGSISSSPTTTTTFTQSAGNQLLVAISNDNFGATPAVNTVTDTVGDTFTKLGEVVGGSGSTSISVWWAINIGASGSNAVTVTWAAAPGSSTIQIVEMTGSTFDTIAINTAASSLTTGVHYSSAIGIAVQANGDNSPGSGFSLLFGAGNQDLYSRLLQNQSSVTVSIDTALYPLALLTFGISSQPTFTPGWLFTEENQSTTPQVTTPTASTINGQTTLNTFPNEFCSPMSNGVNYNAICGFIPNVTTNGVNGASITISAADQTAGVASIGATTLFATPSAPVSRYMLTGYADVTVIGASCAGNTTVVLSAIYTDPNSAGGATTVALGTFTITTNGTLGVSNFSYPPVYFKAKGSTNIQFSTTYTAGGSCSPAPTVQVTPILQVL